MLITKLCYWYPCPKLFNDNFSFAAVCDVTCNLCYYIYCSMTNGWSILSYFSLIWSLIVTSWKVFWRRWIPFTIRRVDNRFVLDSNSVDSALCVPIYVIYSSSEVRRLLREACRTYDWLNMKFRGVSFPPSFKLTQTVRISCRFSFFSM